MNSQNYSGIKCKYIICEVFDLLDEKRLLQIINYNIKLQMLLNELSPSDIEIPMYYPKDKVGKKSREVIMQYCEECTFRQNYS